MRYPHKYTPHPVLHHVSASQIKQHEDCNRLWYYRELVPRGPETDAQAFGKRLHAEVEQWILDGTECTLPLAERLVLTLPGLRGAAGPSVLVEQALRMTLADVPVEGYVDLMRRTLGLWEIWDHKTCSSWRYTKTEATLPSDIQMSVYALWFFQAYPDQKCVRIGHIQANKSTHKIRSPSVVVTRSEAYRRGKSLAAIVRRMVETRQIADVADVPPNLAHCGAYGGCPHKSYCGSMPPTQALAGMFSHHTEDTMNLDVVNKIRAMQGLPPAGDTSSASEHPIVSPAQAVSTAADFVALADETIQPPDAPPDQEYVAPPPPTPLAEQDIEVLGSMSKLVLASFRAAGTSTIGDLVRTHAQGGDAMWLALPGVGQSRVDKIKAELDGLSAWPVEAPAPALAPAPVPAPVHIGDTQVREPLCEESPALPTLLINATVQYGECRPLAPWLRTYTDRVAAGRAHWEQPGDYGEGRKALQAMSPEITAAWLAEGPHVWACSTRDTACGYLVDTLAQAAGLVIVGVT